MTGNFDDAAVVAVYAALESHAKAMNRFQAVDTEQPTASPAAGLYCSVIVGPITLLAAESGLDAATGRVEFHVMTWSQAAKRKVDPTDRKLLSATCALMGEYAGGFTLGGLIRNVDVFGMSAHPGWIDFQGSQCRAFDITLPLVINDMFAEVP